MIRFRFPFSFLVFLSLFAFPSLAFAQSTLTDAQIAKKFYPIKCQIIKGRIDNSSPVNISRQRYIKFPVSGEPGLVMFAEFANVSSGMRTAGLSTSLHDAMGTGGSSIPNRKRGDSLPRESWQFSKTYPTIYLSVVPPTIPSNYEVLIVFARPSPVLSGEQVKKFAFSDMLSLLKNINRYVEDVLAGIEKYDADRANGNVFLEDHPIYLIDMKSMCNEVKDK